MWEKVNAYVEKYQMIEKGDSILIGLSGGADSVCLLRYLLSVKQNRALRIYAVHVNHLLRGEEARRDQQFAEKICTQWNVPFLSLERNVADVKEKQRCSMEEAGRMVRYTCFEEFAKKWECQKIAVAHHKNDLAETMLFRLARGTGIWGLTGIHPVNGKIIRPLLCLEKKEILKILHELKQEYVEDSTNYESDYSRNYIRLHILPELEQINRQSVRHMEQISQQIMEIAEYLSPQIQNIYQQNVFWKGDKCWIDKDIFLNMHPLEQKEIAKKMLTEIAGKKKDISAVHVQQLIDLADKPEGKSMNFPYHIKAKRVQKKLLLLKREKERENPVWEKPEILIDKVKLESEGEWETEIWNGQRICFRLEFFGGRDIEKKDCVKYFNYDTIKSTLCLRTRQSGDYFIMDKEGRHKSLKRYFIDEKISTFERDRVPLLAEKEHILWVFGGRISEAYKVQPDTKRVLIVSVSDKKE